MTKAPRPALGHALGLLGLVLAVLCCQHEAPSETSRPGFEPTSSEPGTLLPVDSELVTGTLPNGVRYLLRPLADERTARLGVVVRAGSLSEEAHERGVAHFVEHVVLDRSQRLGELSTLDFLESQGLEQGSDLNGETFASHTLYHVSLAPEQIERGMEVLAGWMSRVQFTVDAVERQRAAVLAELRESEGRGLSAQLNSKLLAGYPSAERPPLGVQQVLESVPPERLQAFYERWYRAENLVVLAVGRFEPSVLVRQIEAHFAALPSAGGLAVSSGNRATDEPAPGGDQWLLPDPKTEPTLRDVVLHYRLRQGSEPPTEQGYRAHLMDRLLCGVLRDRLAQPEQSPNFAPRPLTCNVQREGQRLQKQLLFIRSKPGALRAAVEGLETEIRRSARFGFLEAERQRAATQILDDLREQAAHPPSADATWRALVGHSVYGDAVLSGATELELAGRLLPQIDVERLRERARQWFEGSRRLVAAVGSVSDRSFSSEAALGELLREIDGRAVPPPHPVTLRQQLMATLPQAGEILRTERVPELGLRVWSLGNGAKVTYKQLESSAEVRLEALEPETSERAGSAAARNTSAARWIVPRGGAGEHDAPALSRLLAGKTTRLAFAPTLTASCSGQDFETTLQLLHLHVVAPRRDFELTEPGPLQGADALASVRAMPPARRGEDLFNAYRNHFGNVWNFNFIVVAGVAEDSTRALVERYLASLPGSPPSAARSPSVTSERNTTVLPSPRLQRLRSDSKAGGNSRLALTFRGQVVSSIEARVEFLALQRYLRLRLREVLREQLRGVYDVDVTGSWTAGRYDLAIAFECRPEHVEMLERATREVIAGLAQPGITDTHLSILRSEWESEIHSRLGSADFWLEELVRAYREAADPRRILELSKLSSQLTRSSLRSAAAAYVPLDARVD